MYLKFFSFVSRSRYLAYCSLSFIFPHQSVPTKNNLAWLVFYSLELLMLVLTGYFSLVESKYPQIFSTLQTILANLDIIVVYTVSIHPLLSNFSSHMSKPFWTFSTTLYTIGFNVMFLSFSSFLASYEYLFIFLLFLIYRLWFTGTTKTHWIANTFLLVD